MSGTSLRPLMPPAALHQEVKTFAAVTSSGSLVKPTSVRTPTLIWLEVTPRSVAPEALPL
jgi:predicted amino acid dehydrogenase